MNLEAIPPTDDVHRLIAALYTADDWCVAYMYIGWTATAAPPSLTPSNAPPSPELLTYVQRQLGAGEYKLIIRGGRTMAFSGEFAVAAPRVGR